MNAASSAYRKVREKTRQSAHKEGVHPQWFTGLVDLLPDAEEKPLEVFLTDREQKEQDHAASEDWYEQLAWAVYDRCTGTFWFEMFIMCNIILGRSGLMPIDAVARSFARLPACLPACLPA